MGSLHTFKIEVKFNRKELEKGLLIRFRDT